MTPIVIDIAEYAESEDIRSVIRECTAIRNRALDICYGIPEYVTAPLETKNRVYDAVRIMLLDAATLDRPGVQCATIHLKE